jgi:hypothetical protein
VIAAHHVTGAYDFLLHVAVQNPLALRDLAMDAFANRAEVAHLETSLIFDVARNSVLPNYLQGRATRMDVRTAEDASTAKAKPNARRKRVSS